jgi:poly-gamma-glutamate capsule biosynthesis protein CapA/YwtB (metallophosphatase superfamily)
VSVRFTLAAVGDIVMTRRAGGVFDSSVREALEPLGAADIAFGDLETPLSRGGYPVEKSLTMRADPEIIEDLKAMHFDIFALANNHMMDWSEVALLDTIALLHANGVKSVGAGADLSDAVAPVLVETRGAIVAFLACTCLLPVGSAAGTGRPGLAPIHVHSSFDVNPYDQLEEPGHPPVVRTRPDEVDIERLAEQIRGVRGSVDFVAVSVHMGFGYQDGLADYERTVSHALVDAGADVVFGNHVHTIKGIESYKGKAIMYSPGNFVAQQPRENQPPEILADYEQMSDDAYIALLDVRDAGSYDLRLMPTYVNGDGLPVLARGDDFDRIAERVTRLSAVLGTTVRVDGNCIAVVLDAS